MGLDPLNQSITKNAADRSFMDKTFTRVAQILNKMAEHNQAWYSEDTTGGIAYGTPSLTNMIKENQERDQVIVGLATNINVLTKMFTESQTKKVNVVEDVQPLSNENCEEANYVHNSQSGYQRQSYRGPGQQNQWRPNPQGQGHQQWQNDQGSSSQGNWSNNNNNYANWSSNPYVPPKGKYSNSSHWKEGSSSESKLENMLEGVLKNQERNDTSMKNMAELVGSHTTSIKNLEMQMRDLSREKNPKQKGALPSDTIANPKDNGSGPTSHCMAITTRSGKVLQGGNEQMVEVDDLEQEVEAQVEVTIVVEVEKLPKEVKVQEANHEGVNEKVKEVPKALAPIPRTMTGWRVCMDYRKLNSATCKDHFPMPFIDQMLDRLAERSFYCFLYGYSDYNQINIALEVQDKTTFTCPYGTFAFSRMPFGLCNATATFQRCMMSIISDMVEDFLEVFMDDFSVMGDSFEHCLDNLKQVLKRCEETNLVLNWEK
ncbi:uncharacterized protein [Nicotiana tomentosiformis]|nr:uncharacterized protein LOC108945656 [Nicotiana tomentosiformis]